MAQHVRWSEIRRRRESGPEHGVVYETTDRAIALGEQIRCAREAQNLTQAELARRMGTVQSAIARLEMGGSDVKLGTLVRLRRALGVELDIKLHMPNATTADDPSPPVPDGHTARTSAR
jgi:transcriptional regulator with XRE-family HTH domain